MKHNLYIFFLIVPVLVNSQSYYEISNPGNSWRDERQWGGEPYDAIHLNYYEVESDTIINTHIYKIIKNLTQQIYPTAIWPGENWEAGGVFEALSFFVRDSLGKIYIPNGILEEVILYDFTLNIGDSLPYNNTNYSEGNFVFSIDSIMIGSDYRKRFNIGNYLSPVWSDTFYVSIIEGIGSTKGLFGILEPPFETYEQLICFTDSGVTTIFAEPLALAITLDDDADICNLIYVEIIQNDFDNTVFIQPNPATDYITLELENNFNHPIITICNAAGQTVMNKLLNNSIEKLDLEISNFIPGIYFLSVNDGINNYSGKFIKN